MSQATLIDLLRHGEPVGGRRYRGQIDDPLSERGWQQMWDTVADAAPWQHIITSPLQRCSAFARTLGAKYNIAVQEDARFREVGFGSWEGHTADELCREDPERITRFFQDPIQQRPEGAEPLQGFAERVTTGLDDVLTQHKGLHVLIVAHAGVVRALLTRVLDAPLASMYRIHVEPASMTRLRADGRRPLTLVFHGSRLPSPPSHRA